MDLTVDAGLAPGRPSTGEPGVVRPHRIGGSAFRRYQDFVVGSRSLLALLRYELLVPWGGALPGAAGLLTRRLLWPGLFDACGRGVVWGRNVVLRHPGRMRIGHRVLVDDDCLFDAKGAAPGDFELADEVVVSRHCSLTSKAGPFRLGPRVNLGVGCILAADGGLTIGADTLVAGHCYIGGGRYDPDGPPGEPMSRRSLPGAPVTIGADCWLGAGVVVLSGVTIGDGCVIGAGSVVTRDIPAHSIAVGAPARAIRTRRAAGPMH